MSKVVKNKKVFDVVGEAALLTFDINDAERYDGMDMNERFSAFEDTLQDAIADGQFGSLQNVEATYEDRISHNSDEVTFRFRAQTPEVSKEDIESLDFGSVLGATIPELGLQIYPNEHGKDGMTVAKDPVISEEEQEALTQFEHALVDSISQGMES